MTDPWMALVAVAFIAIIQSIFGVGLLLIGTPVLILCGLEYQQSLSYLLPSSILISALQIFSSKNEKMDKIPFFCLYGLPFVAVGSLVYFLKLMTFNIVLFIGLMLLMSASIRLSSKLTNILRNFTSRHDKIFVMAIGLLHGYSNMGGTLLTIWAAFKSDSKHSIRDIIAQGYIVFALTQLVMLFIMGNFHISPFTFLIPVAAIFSYISIGRFSFAFINQYYFNILLSLLMLFMGIYLIFKSIYGVG